MSGRNIIAITVLTVVAMMVFVGMRISSSPAALSTTTTTTKTTMVKTTKAVVAPPMAGVLPLIRVSSPRTVSIPALGVRASIVKLGLTANHQVQVPKTTTVVGWYKLGPAPGQIGSSVLLAHVDSTTGPGVFFYLKNLQAGNLVNVTLANGTVTHFRVEKVVEYSKTAFPDRLVYGNHRSRELQLVTCGGAFDRSTGSYESNVVVFTKYVGATRA
ncbi:MAG TPA: class F sortase [Acidimicrobiales bacterium]|nr:class F sortase [Acidimicrobiales bacterium]